MNGLSLLTGCSIVLLTAACTSEDGGTDRTQQPADTENRSQPMDPHSAARPNEARITHLDLDLRVDMDARRIEGTATYDIKADGARSIVFDTDGLEIQRVTLADGGVAKHVLGDSSVLGRPLAVEIPEGTRRLSIAYRTGPGARALQWLAPRQTTDKHKPFLFTQGQAILTRTWIPIQDSPGIRITYNATVQVPADLMAVMSASNPRERSADGRYSFRMDQPIPPYLIALAVGDLAFKPIGTRTGVYAEPGVVQKAAWEFADMENMLVAAEELYGPYRWERYDVIVLPASFPFGGMENPRLTFATPTILAGDRSLTALVAHELAHSWSGNLVTNATWDDFWINEGFTVYFEKRICEKIYGKDHADMLALLGYQDLKESMDKIAAGTHPEDTRLKLDLAGRDPDDGVTDVAYEKGYAFLRLLEEKAGRPAFDAFLRAYFDAFAFQSMTTERFIDHLKQDLLVPKGITVDIDQWVYRPGMPADLIIPASDRFDLVDREIERWTTGTPAGELATRGWSTFEWMHFLRNLPAGLARDRMAELDGAFGFTASGNAEVLGAWLEQCVRNDYAPAYEKLDVFLTTVGRRKFVQPLFEELIKTEKGRAMAANIYKAARPNYHSVTVRTIDEVMNWKEMGEPITM